MEITEAVTLTLKPEELNIILAAVERLPYRDAKPILDEIHKQVLAQVSV